MHSVDMDDDVPLPDVIRAAIHGYTSTRVTDGESGGTVVRLEARNRPTLYLKAGRGNIATDIANEVARLHWLTPRIAAPTVVKFIREPDSAFVITTAVAGISAYRHLVSHPGLRVRTVAAVARFMQVLHALPVTDCPFDAGNTVRLAEARRHLDAGRVDVSDFDDARLGWTAEGVWAEMTGLLPLPFQRAVTHGDYSLDNILIGEDGDVTGIIDVGRAGVADPYQDIAILWNSLGEFGEDLQLALWHALGITKPDERKLRFHLCLDEFF